MDAINLLGLKLSFRHSTKDSLITIYIYKIKIFFFVKTEI